jgi:hypothetical protein
MTNTPESDTMKTLLQSAKDNGAYVTMSFDDEDKLYPSEITFHNESQLLATFNAWSVQQGWKLVPIEPTDAMCDAGVTKCGEGHYPDNVWREMLSASPTAPIESDK